MPLFELSSRYGGHWKEHPKYASRDWRRLVWDGETRLGYWEWVERSYIDDAFDDDIKHLA
jgi:hypothetical protein